jgi:YfiR/HmsC-like
MKCSTTIATVQDAHRDRGYAREGRVRQNLALVTMMVILLRIPVLQAQQPKASEYQVKATYLYNFGRFVQWPTTISVAKGDLFPICVIGQDPFGPDLDAILTGEIIDGKAVVAKRVSKPQDAVSCRILYISSSEESRLKEVLAALDKAEVLTVSDMPDFLRRGGMIQFVLKEGRVRFEINLTSAEAARLMLSADLLKVASNVRKNGPVGD